MAQPYQSAIFRLPDIKLRTHKRRSFKLGTRLAFALCLLCAMVLGPVSAQGQSAVAAVPPAVAAQLKAAKKVFIAPLRDEDGSYFYDVIVETVEIWRLYEQVPEGAGADLIFEPSITPSQLRLAVRATSTENVLWVFSRPVKEALLPSNWENNFAGTIPALLDDVRQAKGQAVPAAPPQNTPPPAQFSTPPKVFISNVAAGDDSERFLLGNSPYTGGVGQAYNKFYDAVQGSGRYQLVMTPAEADLIFEIRFADEWRSIIQSRDKKTGAVDDVDLYYGQLTLVVWDRRTGGVLRAVTESIGSAFRAATADKNFTKAVQALLDEAAVATGPPAAKPQPTQTVLSLPHQVPDAPVPQIGAAGKLFIAKPGEGRVYQGEAALDLYGQVQAALQQWGRYKLVTTASDADLVLEPAAVGGMLRLSIVDPGTSVALWAFREGGYVEDSNKMKQNVHDGAAKLMNTLRNLDMRANGAVSPSPGGSKSASKASPGPVPSGAPPAVSGLLTAAKKVYISHIPPLADSDDRKANEDVYNKVTTALKAWGKYQLAASAAEADLVFEPSIVSQDVQLAIINPNAGGRVWTFTQHADGGMLQSSRERNVERAIAALVDSMRKVATDATGESPGSSPSAPQSR